MQRSGLNRTTKHGKLTQRKKTALAGSRCANGPPTDTTTGTEVPGFKRGPGRPRANWIGTVKKDLRKMTLTWEEAEWRRSVAQCIHVEVKVN